MLPIHWAVANKDLDVVNFLLQNGADPLQYGWNKVLPIDIAGIKK